MEKTRKIIDYVKEIENKLKKIYVDPILCRQYAWWILESITDTTKARLIAQQNIMLTSDQQEVLSNWINRLVEAHLPIQYLLGSVPFCNLDILVEPPVLIPRPETEEWVSSLIEQLKTLNNQVLTILDIGSGSGCIALALAHALPRARIYATDISKVALNLAQKNARHNAITNIFFIESDIYAGLPKNLRFDLIVSNPPYITPRQWQTLDISVTAWEDKRALVADDNGLALIKKIITGAQNFLKSNTEMAIKNIPQLILEIGYTQGNAVAKLFADAHFTNIQIHKDLEKKDRTVSGRIRNVATSRS